ncbi:MAG TPA: UDP-N-acetylmuramate dehydrogenase [Edaphocola sp.]|nr:UDP-N-acetylmuramate dehydrogenase [Edaphocola sp.]
MQVYTDYPLDTLNTFGMKVKAAFFSELRDAKECEQLAQLAPQYAPILVLGGGSNMLFLNNPKRWVIKNEIKGISLLEETDEYVQLRVSGGEVWHEFVLYCIDNGYCGLENLSLIPGTVGAAPIQNIGAYGVEVKRHITKVHFWHLEHQRFESLDNKDCNFGYRDSVFKHDLKGKVIITAVDWRLSKHAQLDVSYGNIKDELQRMGISRPGIKDVSDAVIAIRTAKLPNPAEIGNAGSFFKNPVVEHSVYQKIKAVYPDAPGYAVDENSTKLPAAWLIEQSGLKGYQQGAVGVHHRQALVLVNLGGATGEDIYQLSEHVINTVKEKFGISLEREVQMVG